MIGDVGGIAVEPAMCKIKTWKNRQKKAAKRSFLSKKLQNEANWRGKKSIFLSVWCKDQVLTCMKGSAVKRNENPSFSVLFPCSFRLLVHINIIPKLDVAAAQEEIYLNLTNYYDHNDRLRLQPDPSTICITPLGKKQFWPVTRLGPGKQAEILIWNLFLTESFPTTTINPPTLVTEFHPVTTTVPPSTTPSITTPIPSTTRLTTFTRTAADTIVTKSPANTSGQYEHFES